MRKIKKFLIWLIVLLIPIGLVTYQNKTFFLKEVELKFFYIDNLTKSLPIFLLLLIVFFTGLLISYFSSLSEKYIARKNIRRLTEEVDTEKKKVLELETIFASAQAAQKANNSALSSGPADVPEL